MYAEPGEGGCYHRAIAEDAVVILVLVTLIRRAIIGRRGTLGQCALEQQDRGASKGSGMKAGHGEGDQLLHAKVEVSREDRHEMIAVAAYFRAEHRGFVPGHEVQDWLDASLVIDRMVKECRNAGAVREAYGGAALRNALRLWVEDLPTGDGGRGQESSTPQQRAGMSARVGEADRGAHTRSTGSRR